MTDLVLTNGDSSIELIRNACGSDDLVIMPWRDVLHEGPLTPSGQLDDFALVRAKYLSDEFGLVYSDVMESFVERNETVKRWNEFDKVSLWFEHDLYDQLQLLEILNFFSGQQELNLHKMEIVQSDVFLGLMTAAEAEKLTLLARPATKAELDLAKQAWVAFCSETPESWASMLEKNCSSLPYLKLAVLRQLEELPDNNGITRTERQILKTLAEKPSLPTELFHTSQAMEEAAFMGDWSFFSILERLSQGEMPLVESRSTDAVFCRPGSQHWKAFSESSILLTLAGSDVLREEVDYGLKRPASWIWAQKAEVGEIVWRWNRNSQCLRLT
jgi:hypothetical protein